MLYNTAIIKADIGLTVSPGVPYGFGHVAIFAIDTPAARLTPILNPFHKCLVLLTQASKTNGIFTQISRLLYRAEATREVRALRPVHGYRRNPSTRIAEPVE